jgi:hypothetical protein
MTFCVSRFQGLGNKQEFKTSTTKRPTIRKSREFFLCFSLACTLPRYFAKIKPYCKGVTVETHEVSDALPNRITASAKVQKYRTPV